MPSKSALVMVGQLGHAQSLSVLYSSDLSDDKAPPQAHFAGVMLPTSRCLACNKELRYQIPDKTFNKALLSQVMTFPASIHCLESSYMTVLQR